MVREEKLICVLQIFQFRDAMSYDCSIVYYTQQKKRKIFIYIIYNVKAINYKKERKRCRK